jgi:hypothetical protein
VRPIDEAWVKAAAYGGAILGGGGGGSLEEGLRLGRLALDLGRPTLAEIDELADEETIVTVSAVGAPSQAQAEDGVKPTDYARAVRLLHRQLEREIAALLPSEVGGLAALNGTVQSAILGIPVLNAACNGRAHPTGLMGAMGLDRKLGYVSRQVAVSGSFALYVEGDLQRAAQAVRRAAELAGGLVAVARNPVPLAYVRAHAAVGALSLAVQVGQAFLQAREGPDRVEQVAQVLGGQILAQGRVDNLQLRAEGGFDLGHLRVGGVELTFCNEYMTLERDGERLATFPDLIVTFEAHTGRPVTSAEVHSGQELLVLVVPKERLKLGAGMRNPELFRDVEAAALRNVEDLL